MLAVPHLIPDMDRKGWISIVCGFIASFLTLFVVHYLSASSRRVRKESDLKSKSMSEDDKREDREMTAIMKMEDPSSPIAGTKPKQLRYCFIDLARGLAISFVTFFHYVWNLRHNGILPDQPRIADPHELFIGILEFWVFYGVCFVLLSELFHKSVYLGYIGFSFVTTVCILWHYWPSQLSGVGIIMFCVGISSYVQNCEVIRWDKIFARIRKLFLVSLAITVTTLILLPETYVYFGAIHCITLVSILHLPFLKFPKYSILGSVFIFSYKGFIGTFPLEILVYRPTVDHMPWFENLGYLLVGLFAGYIGMHKAPHYTRCMWGRFTPGIHLEDTVFPLLGRYSLPIFILHQVVLFPLVKLFSGHSLVG